MTYNFTYHPLFISLVDDFKEAILQLYVIPLSQRFGVHYEPFTLTISKIYSDN
jgi:hypothetical protein